MLINKFLLRTHCADSISFPAYSNSFFSAGTAITSHSTLLKKFLRSRPSSICGSSFSVSFCHSCRMSTCWNIKFIKYTYRRRFRKLKRRRQRHLILDRIGHANLYFGKAFKSVKTFPCYKGTNSKSGGKYSFLNYMLPPYLSFIIRPWPELQKAELFIKRKVGHIDITRALKACRWLPFDLTVVGYGCFGSWGHLVATVATVRELN